MHSGTRPVCNCSAMNLCISSVRKESWEQPSRNDELMSHLWPVARTSAYVPTDRRMVKWRRAQSLLCTAAFPPKSSDSTCTYTSGSVSVLRQDTDGRERRLPIFSCPTQSIGSVIITKAITISQELTGSKTNIWHSKCTASCVAWELKVYRADNDGCFGTRLSMWVLAPSHACLMSSIEGVPSSSVISSSCKGVGMSA